MLLILPPLGLGILCAAVPFVGIKPTGSVRSFQYEVPPYSWGSWVFFLLGLVFITSCLFGFLEAINSKIVIDGRLVQATNWKGETRAFTLADVLPGSFKEAPSGRGSVSYSVETTQGVVKWSNGFTHHEDLTRILRHAADEK